MPIAWHDPSTRERLKALVREVEAQSAAELVLTVRPSSGDDRAADLLFAAVLAFAGLCVYVYAPWEFTDDLTPPSILALFLGGYVFSSRVPAVRRLFSRRAQREARVRAAARAAFVDQGIASTRDRTGILIYVSLFERAAEVVVDIGVLRRESEGQPAAAIEAIARVVREGGDLPAFEAAVRDLGAFLAGALPPRLDDQNELSDEVNVA
ncbi:MAG: hypothetical protein U0359_06260 [Byssovorax sp.]